MTNRTIGSALLELKSRSGLSLAAIARAAGYGGPSSVQAFFHANYDPPALDIGIAKRLIAALSGYGSPPIQDDDILALLKLEKSFVEKDAGLRPNFLDSDVPVYETKRLDGTLRPRESVGGLAMMLVNFSEPLRYYPRSAGLAWSNGAYALHVVGGSMSPRLKDGEPFFISGSKAPAIGDDVLIKLRAAAQDGEPNAFSLIALGRLNGWDDRVLNLEQYGGVPAQAMGNHLVEQVHRIAPWAEVCGLPYA